VIGDGGGKERTARRPIRGAAKVARFVPDLLVLEIDADGWYEEVIRVAGGVSEVHQPFTVRSCRPTSSAASASLSGPAARAPYGRLTPPLADAYRQVLDGVGVSRCKPGAVAPL